MVKRILFFTLSNFGDVVLSLPALDVLRQRYPDARITVMVGPRAAEIFQDNPYIHNLIIYDKYAPLRKKISLFFKLNKQHFDVVIDLRNSLYGALLPAEFKTSPFLYTPSRIRHMKEKNLYRLSKALGQELSYQPREDKLLYINWDDREYVNNLFYKNGINPSDKIIIVSPAAGGKTRRWDKEKFIQLCQRLSGEYSVILIGREEDKALTSDIRSNCQANVFDFAGLTNLAQLSFLLKSSCLLVVCDTGTLQLASYLDIPIVALFGPSDEQRYGPWSARFKVAVGNVPCRPCRRPDCRFNTSECMHKINPDEVLDLIDALLK